MTAAEIFTRDLKSRGIEWMATLCGHGLDPLFQAARQAGIRLIDTRNEQTASYIAEAAGRLTRQPGVCAVSSGVAQVNALTGVTNAWFDCSPMLLISGSAAMSTEGLGHFQDMDQVTVARPLTKFSRSIDCAARVRQILDEALRKSTEGVPGPTHLMFPMDVQNTNVGDAALVAPSALPTSQSCAGSGVDEIVQALAKSRKPLIVAGSGVFYDRSGPAMLRFAEEQNVPIVTPIWDRGSVDQPSPVFMGVIGAATGGAPILNEADCVLLAGVVGDYRLGYLRPPAVKPETRLLPFHGAWDALAGSCSKRDRTSSKDWLGACARRRDEFRSALEQRARESAGGKMNAADVVRAIEGTLSEDPVLLVDGGSIGQWAHQLLCTDRYPGHWLTCGRSGVVGWGSRRSFMAARLVYPNRPVILFSGDGAFTFNVSDLEAAARQNLSFVAVIADDLGWGITRVGHVRQFGEPIASSLGPIAFDRLAESLGARGVRAETPGQLAGELRRAMSDAAVTVIHVPIVGGNPGQ